MGSWLCCVSPIEVPQENGLLDGDVLGNVIVETKDSEFIQIGVTNSPVQITVAEEVVTEQNDQFNRQQGSNQMQHVDSLSELEKLSETGDFDWKNSSVYERGDQVDSELDSSTDETISQLFQVPCGINYEEDGLKVEEIGSNQHQRKSSAQIGPQAEVLEVQGAGNSAVNGVYRYFAAHGRYVMFADHGQYQIIGGVNLSELGDRYHNCWVIEKIMEIVVRLYAVASNDITSVPCDGWICIDGSSPAPIVKGGEERKYQEEKGYNMGIEQSDESLSSLPISNLPKQFVVNDLDGVDGVEWVA